MNILHKIHRILPISIYQKRFWLEWAKNPNSSAYNLSSVYEFTNNLDKHILKKACNLLILKHENLHAQFDESGEHCYFGGFSIDDFYTEIKLNNEKSALDQVFQLLNKPFLSIGGTLLKFFLLSKNDGSFFIIKAQHSIVDGTSLKKISHEICKTYNLLLNNNTTTTEIFHSFSNYIHHEKEKLKKINSKLTRKFWQDFLNNLPLSMKLPNTLNEASILGIESKTIYFKSTFNQTIAIKKLAIKNKTTVFVVLASLYALHLSKYFNQKQFLISYPVNMRPKEYTGVVGCFVNNLPLKIILNKEHQKLTDIIKYISQQRKNVSPHSWYPLIDIIQDQRKTREQLESGILNVGFASTNLNVEPLIFCGAETKNIEIPWNNQAIYHLCLQYDFSLKDLVCFKLEYQKNKIDSNVIELFLDSFKMLLEKIIDGDFFIKDYFNLGASEKLKIFNDSSRFETFPNNKTLNELFEDQVDRLKDHIALVHENKQISYSELNRKANQLARYIRLKFNETTKKSINARDFIILYLDRGIEQVLAILAVLKAGAAYVPIAIDHPIGRVQHILEDTQANIVLTQKKYIENLKKCSYDIVFLAINKSCYNNQKSENLPAYNQASDIAYVIYTSGTTGQSKGVLQPHCNVMRLFTSTEDDFKFSKNDVWTLYHSYAFDFSVWEMWGALIYGGKLIIPTTTQITNISEFFNLCLQHKITVLNQTPTAFYQLSQIMLNTKHHTLSSLRYIILGGEALKSSQLKFLWQYYHKNKMNTEVINMYGITETTVHVTLKRLNPNDNKTICNIGKPLRDLVVYVLNQELEPVPIGIEGELYVGGAGVAVGYLNLPDLTHEKFVDNPFVNQKNSPISRLYKTGDIVRYLANGELEYIGRDDKQIKIRGYRIELKEIENILTFFPELEHYYLLSEDMESDKILVCYFTGNVDNTLLRHIQNKMRDFLPAYMIPSYWHFIPSFPLTINNKIDAKKLRKLVLDRQKLLPEQTTTNLQKEIISAWTEILQTTDFGLDDNFFDVGGNSIKVVSLYLALKMKLSIEEITLVDVFKYPSIRKYSDFISEKFPLLLKN